MSRQEDIKAPPPGPIQPIFNDSLSHVERERRHLRRIASQYTSPEAQENVTSAAAAFGARNGKLPGAGARRPALPKAPQPKGSVVPSLPIRKTAAPTPTPSGNQSTLQKQIDALQAYLDALKQQANQQTQPVSNLIVPVNAQGQPVADERPQAEQPKLTFSPAPDGTFCKIADRPRPKNHPIGQPWSQKILATHNNEPFAIVRDGHVAELLSNALNVYFHALMQRQAELEAKRQAEAAAANDANVFDAMPADENAEPAVEDAADVDALTGASAAEVGEPSAIEQLPSL